jgi:transposase
MRAIHGGKTKDDKIDSRKIAQLLRGGNLPIAYAYPKGLRETRDLLRRRGYLVRKRAELVTHIQMTNSQYNLPPFGKKLVYARNRAELNVADRFTDPSVRTSIELDLALIDKLDELIGRAELYLERTVKVDDADTYYRLRSIPGVGKILGLVLLYEIHDITRFTSEGQFLSYARLVKPKKTSQGKVTGGGGGKIGNAHLKWAFSELACLFAREDEQAKRFLAKKSAKHGKAKALGILAARLGRSVYALLVHKRAFDVKRFWGNRQPAVARGQLAVASDRPVSVTPTDQGRETSAVASDRPVSQPSVTSAGREQSATATDTPMSATPTPDQQQSRPRAAAKPRTPAVTSRLRKGCRRVCQA